MIATRKELDEEWTSYFKTLLSYKFDSFKIRREIKQMENEEFLSFNNGRTLSLIYQFIMQVAKGKQKLIGYLKGKIPQGNEQKQKYEQLLIEVRQLNKTEESFHHLKKYLMIRNIFEKLIRVYFQVSS